MKLVFLKNFFLLTLKSCYIIIFLLFFSLNTFTQSRFKIPEKPLLLYPVQDYAHLFSNEEKLKLNTSLIKYAKKTSTEILIVTIESLNGDDANVLASTWGEKWEIGQKEKNNGIVFLIAVKDKKTSIQVGRYLEDPLTDGLIKRIIENRFKPYAKKRKFYEAINTSIEAIQNVLLRIDIHETTKESKTEISYWVIIFFLIILFIIIILSKNNNEGDSNKHKDVLIDRRGKKYVNTDWGWDSIDGKDYSGGFGGFGSGGSFGGGGSSGSW